MRGFLQETDSRCTGMIRKKYPWNSLRSQIGSRAERRRSEAMLLTRSELQGVGWERRSTHSWRIRPGRIANEEAERAFELGRFASLRVFRKARKRELFLQVIPYASTEDARSMVPKIWRTRTPYPRNITVVDEQNLEHEEVPDLTSPWLLQQRIEGKAECVRVVIGHVDHVAVSVGCVALRDDWPWEEVKELASVQGRKVRQILRAGSA